MTKEVIVESFELDHTIVKAPYVRLISEEFGPKGDVITNFDVRLVQPNQNSIETAGLHTIESCGNYKDHSLFAAKEWAKLILSQGISDQAFERHLV
ncbi:S-ribosylhomocysteine lyase [Streptococcus uberis]|uniref:S-ribosylhomocysteine lyase n=1 Tax=Streptococcus uberis TaxID=1349 RepID=UPI0020BE800E|nr:S-ribosylhomocysteine lyase [Streptococcus uberis]